MAAPNWTREQKNAIRAKGGSLLISAAAGSGKTAVLTRRVIERVIDEDNPCDIDKILAVTFTKAAASEMKERISRELTALLEEDPHNYRLLRQQLLIPSANIRTIDSLCGELVRNNFQKLGISPDYRTLDSAELAILSAEAVEETLNELYSEDSPEFEELLEAAGSGGDDKTLEAAIVDLYVYINSYPFPWKWLEEKFSLYENPNPPFESPFGKIIRRFAIEALDQCENLAQDALRLCGEEEKFAAAYSPTLIEMREKIEELRGSLNDWDALSLKAGELSFSRFKSLRGFTGHPTKNAIFSRRDNILKILKQLSQALCCTQEEYFEDMRALAPLVKKLFEAVRLYGDKLDKLKADKNALDFSDVMHLALELLIETRDGQIKRTPLAEEMSENFEEIMIDECQDINQAQDMLFWAASRDGSNIFMVGDVKQSIYGFRQAMPEIFLKRKNDYGLYDSAREDYPAKILLGKNFRSRKGITSCVNFIFRQLMSLPSGELDYSDEESLIPGGDYSDRSGPDAEIHVIYQNKASELGKNEREAAYIAGLIKEKVDKGHIIKDKDETRPVRYGDFCVLLRSFSSKASDYARSLQNCGVPARADTPGGFFDSPETAVAVSILRSVDNPLRDVSILSAMLSPVFGFDADDLAALRCADKRVPVYASAMAAAKNGDPKCQNLISQLEIYRKLSSSLSIEELIRRIYETTGYYAMVQAMPNGVQRKANLNMLLEYAKQYQGIGGRRLPGFIRFLDMAEERKSDLPGGKSAGESGDYVRIMTIHRSKGLEFPICVLAGCSGQFNRSSTTGNALTHNKLGIAFKRLDRENLRRFPTMAYEALKLDLRRSEISEEMRVFYVAMTRAKENLIMTMTLSNPEKTLTDIGAEIEESEKISPFRARKAVSFAHWILACALRHPDSANLREAANMRHDLTLPADFRLKTEIVKEFEEKGSSQDEDMLCLPDEDLLEKIKANIDYRYPYMEINKIPAKIAASDLSQDGLNAEYIAVSRPRFLSEEGLSPAERGIAIHKIMQYIDYAEARENLDGEIERLAELRFISEEEKLSVDRERLRLFFESSLADRIFKSERMLREYKFAINVNAREYDSGLPEYAEDERVFAQGISDCVFVEDGGLVIVDYKTDRVKRAEDLIKMYKPQMDIYKKALNESLDMPVKECVLYSFWRNKAVAL